MHAHIVRHRSGGLAVETRIVYGPNRRHGELQLVRGHGMVMITERAARNVQCGATQCNVRSLAGNQFV